MGESYDCVTVGLHGPKLHLFQACKFREEKISGKKQRLILLQNTCKRWSDRLPADGDSTAFEMPLKGCRHLFPVSWVVGKEIFPYEKTEEEILFFHKPRGGMGGGSRTAFGIVHWCGRKNIWLGFRKPAFKFCFSHLMILWSWVSLLISPSFIFSFIIWKMMAIIPGSWNKQLRQLIGISWHIVGAQWTLHSLSILFPVCSDMEI